MYRSSLKPALFHDFELDESGVTRVWKWQCYSYRCVNKTVNHGTALYWENALRGLNRHLTDWHQES